MKKTILAIAALICTFTTYAQNERNDGSEAPRHAKKNHYHPPAYFVLSTGLNNNGGLLGLGVDIPVCRPVSIEAGVGLLSTWGYKFYGGAKYYLDNDGSHEGWALGVDVTFNTGIAEYKTQLETVYGDKDDVTLDLKPQTNIFFGAYKYWHMGRHANRFHLQLGWSVGLTSEKFTQTAGWDISSSASNTMKFISPGGLVVGIGFSFAGHGHK